MKALFCCQTHVSRELGGTKVIIELSEELERLGWECDLISPADLAAPQERDVHENYHIYLRRYLQQHAAGYDVIDFDYFHLPYPRSDFPEQPLFVARSVLLIHHFSNIQIPESGTLKSRVRSLLLERDAPQRLRRKIERANIAFREADLINVLNDDDQAELVRSGILKDKIVVLPNGLSQSTRARFRTTSSTPPAEPRVAFVGTFDSRKGATDFPKIVEGICSAVPEVSFRLLGTGRTQQAVLAGFPTRLRDRIEVLTHFPAETLPELLAPCSVGVFPSYIEGFGLGVLEMLAASIPVIAYDSPGPTVMLPPEFLVSRGDTRAMSAKVIELLKDEDKLAAARQWSRQRSEDFRWERIAEQTAGIYAERFRRRQSRPTSETFAQTGEC